MVFIKTLMNVDQIHCYLLQLKLNLLIGPISNFKILSMVANFV